MSLKQQHTRTFDGLNHAQHRANLDAWARWAKGIPLDERQRDVLEDAYQHRFECVPVAEAATGPRRLMNVCRP